MLENPDLVNCIPDNEEELASWGTMERKTIMVRHR